MAGDFKGCGMIHPNVFANVGYPKDKYSGFAFGMGIERIAMLKYGMKRHPAVFMRMTCVS